MDNQLHSPTPVTCPPNLTRLHPQGHKPGDKLYHQNSIHITQQNNSNNYYYYYTTTVTTTTTAAATTTTTNVAITTTADDNGDAK